MDEERRATSNDVARLANVSQATVSLVFSSQARRSRVSAATRQRVLQAAETLGYVPHRAAQALRTGRSDIIAFVPRGQRTRPTVFPVPFQFSLYLSRAALRHGLHVIEVGADGDPALAEIGLAAFLKQRRVDGVVVDGPENSAVITEVVASGIPVVQAIRPHSAITSPTITVDPAPGIGQAIDHLRALGHRRIAFLGRGGAYPVDQARLDSFLAALARHGLAAAGDVQLTPAYDVEQAFGAANRLLVSPAPPTAIFAAGDNLALGVLRALYAARLRVPDDLSVISYDDVFAADLYPPLSSVSQPLAEVAERAVALLLEARTAPTPSGRTPPRIAVPTGFVVRASTARPPALADQRGHAARAGAP